MQSLVACRKRATTLHSEKTHHPWNAHSILRPFGPTPIAVGPGEAHDSIHGAAAWKESVLRMPGGQFLEYLRARTPWVVAITVVVAVSIGAVWATSRIDSLNTDLAGAAGRSSDLRERVRRLESSNNSLTERAEDLQERLTDITASNRALGRRYEELRRCVTRSNPDGGPIVSLLPDRGPVGTKVEMVGFCFVDRPKRQGKRASETKAWLTRDMDVDGFDCELIAPPPAAVRISRDGRMRGHLIVPSSGRCFKKGTVNGLEPGRYRLAIGCRTCSVSDFQVTTEAEERGRLADCTAGDYGWAIEGPGIASGVIVIGVGIFPQPGRECRFTRSASVSIINSVGTPLDVQGSPGAVEFDGAVGRQRVGAAWAWSNWCAAGPYRVRATVGTQTKVGSIRNTGPRCNSRKRSSFLRPIGALMDGVAGFPD